MIVPLTKEKIDSIFSVDEKNPEYFILELYKEVTPYKWDMIKNINHFPKINRNTADYIFDKLLKKAGSDLRVTTGMLWVNKGFGCSDTVDEWTCLVEKDKIEVI